MINATRFSAKAADVIIDKMIAPKNAERRFGKTNYLKAGQEKYNNRMSLAHLWGFTRRGLPKRLWIGKDGLPVFWALAYVRFRASAPPSGQPNWYKSKRCLLLRSSL
jgi:hypothetical protein